jgi:ribosomal protein L11 methyltransferase
MPSWSEDEPGPGDRVIRLDPGMAFGTGLHPTTQLCLAEIEKRAEPGTAVLDVGTGSGILAIGAALLGARPVVAIDTSPAAIEVAEDNAAVNGVALETVVGELPAMAPAVFDVIAANLLAGTIIELAAELFARLRPGGTLVASGILCDQSADVSAALEVAGFAPPGEQRSGDWSALIGVRPHRRGGPRR